MRLHKISVIQNVKLFQLQKNIISRDKYQSIQHFVTENLEIFF